MTEYWGGMARLGADTFWELYNPKNPDESRTAELLSIVIVMHGAVHRYISCVNILEKIK